MNNEINYQQLLLTKSWKVKRSEILKRDKHECVNCSSVNSLNVHHKQYHYNKKTSSKVYPWDYLSKYLITLCTVCHKNGHENYKVPSFGI